MSNLCDRISASPYLTRLSAEWPALLALRGDALIAHQRQIIAQMANVNHTELEADGLEAAEQRLIKAKQEFSLAWCLTELDNAGTQVLRGQLQTEFAEVTIQFALALAWRRLANKQAQIAAALRNIDVPVPGLFVLGMGKLGGRDLNFSSDVDLVAFFDHESLPVPELLGKSYVCHQVLQELTRLLSQGGSSNFIWRVDWRLRPNASATSLAMSMTAAEDYYHYQASPWHRLALMKARVIAGDIALGDEFLDSLNSFIWRQNLDYRAFDDLAEIKQRINLEHPGLRAQRQWVQPIGDDIEGFNVKLGSGGIREVEFFVNAQQLLLGGRYKALKTPSTVEALTVLIAQERIDRDTGEALIQAYQFLRKVENAVQMHGNQHTHLLPSGPQNKLDILQLLGFENWSDLVIRLNRERHFVNELFTGLFADREQQDLGPLVWPEGINEAADEVIEAWENGFQIYGVSNSVRHKLKPLLHALADYLNEGGDHSGADVSDVILRLHGFFRSLPQGEQYFRLLAESPALLHSVIPPLLYSPPMATLLTQSPHIIDCYVHGEWHYPEPFDAHFIDQNDDYGEQLERLRRFVNEHLYQLYQQFLRGKLSVETFQAALTDLAEYTVELALEMVAKNMHLDEVPITVIGMGKKALRRMSPMSDLDLIFVYDAEHTTLDLASRYVSRLQTAIASPMREGIVYDLDTRLRPSGKSGAPTVSVDSFENHHHQRARTWEHIALMPSRVVAGRRDVEERINSIKREIIHRSRDPEQLRMDARKMWARITEHRVGDTPLANMNSKLRVGGLMQAEYLASCLTLDYGARFTSQSIELEDLLAECLPHYGMEELPDAMQFWRIQQLWERLLGKTEQPLSSLRDAYFNRLLEHSNCASMDELLAKKKRYVDLVVTGLHDFFADANDVSDTELDDWQEASVVWR